MAITNASTLAEYASGISTQGATLTVDQNNKRVGIGTTNPQAMLQVGTGVTVFGNAGIASFTSLKLSGDTDSTSTSTGALTVTGGVGIGLSLTVGGDVSVGGTITYEDVTNVDSLGIVTARSGLRVVGGGVTCVGVATFFNNIDANGSLDVAGDVSIADKIVHTGDTNTLIRFPTTGTIQFDTDGDERLRITSAGLVLIPGDVSIADRIVHTGDTNTLIRFPAAGTIRFDTDGDERMRITSAGKVGIGSDNPQDYLDILNTSTNANISLKSTANSFNTFIFDTNRSGANDNLSLIDARWNGNTVSRIQFITGSDTTNKDDGYMAFHTRVSGSALAERLRIDSSGRVLIGTGTSKSAGSGQYAKLNVEGGVSTTENFTSFSRAEAASAMSANDEVANLTFNDSAGYEFARIQVLADAATGATDTPGRIVFKTTADGASSSTNRLTIDKDGDVMMGNLAYNEGNALNVVSNTYDGIGVYRHSNNASTPLITLGKSRGSTGGSTTVVQSGDYLGRIGFEGADGDEMVMGATIECHVDDTPGNNDMPSRLVFNTVPNGSTSLTERLRITSSGDVSISGDGTIHGVSKLTILPADRTDAFSASDGDTWHDIVLKQTGDAATNAVGLAFEVSTSGYHKNAGTGIACVKNGTASDYGSDLVFITRGQSTAATEKLRISSTGDIHSANKVQSGGNTTSGFIIGSPDVAAYIGVQSKSVANGGSTGNAAFQAWLGSSNTFRVNANGLIKTSAGIDFSGAQTNTAGMTSETLDQYEEGTWTPTVYGATDNGTITGGTFVGHYTKIGREVRAYFALGNFTLASASGNLTIGSLPFAADSPLGDWGANTFGWYNFDMPDNMSGAPILYVSDNATYVTGLYFTDNGTWGGVSISNGSGKYLKGCVAYTTD